ncbi:hypothetical protein AAFF_G00116170 [Aldrovandia affinis]|uniref:Alkylated DNA repair protein AlkB homologue 8 N-terminal domain-containing protein n=1 Tax=Aldrovandia affinis TaxID=143900 RepID=A0AAD7T1J8_9TELE|nr:hypothetical protein AAFF_G00116170 [Aldrovandia affinis]
MPQWMTCTWHCAKGPAQDHGPALEEFMEWCDTSCLELNVTKVMVVVISSRQQESRLTSAPTLIHGEPVKVLQQYKYLGTVFDDRLRFDTNTEDILKKCQQLQYFMKKVNSFGVNRSILTTFYNSFTESTTCTLIPS